jgi:uncharacterized protein (DUF427 family)
MTLGLSDPPHILKASYEGNDTMVKAVWNNTTIAESDSVEKSLLRPSATTSNCPWKGTANYYSLEVDGQTNKDAVWYYAEPSDAAKQIKNRVAFWKGVKVQ